MRKTWPTMATLGAAVSISLCVSAGAKPAALPVTGDRLEAVQSSVRGRLKDPESARFELVFSIQKGSGEFVCGRVNAKNGFGGYNGATPFSGLLLKRGAAFSFENVSIENPNEIRDMCLALGIYI
ncbi:hypothetical protein NKI96_10660 [Mesorhizobium sp. M0292]|uniref:hypothetical protein n=1 Tax=Mesorhizobium sp. M0292 TaxID=2956929 RepID=UPI003339A07D